MLIRTDNILAKAYLNNQGGSRFSTLHREVIRILTWEEKNLALVIVEHIQGAKNI